MKKEDIKITIRGITLTRKDIDFIYNLYVESILALAKIKPIIMVGIYDKSPSNPKMDTNNPYVKGNWLTELGESVLKNGTHWIYIVRHRKFISGNHRIMSLRYLAEAGVISKDHKVLCIDLEINSSFGKCIIIKTLVAEELDDLAIHGLKTVTKSCVNYRAWITSVLRIPKMMKEILYEFKQVTGEEYPTQLEINDINELKRRVNK